MRVFVSVISALMSLAVSSEAFAAGGLAEFAGRWREPTGSCEAPYLTALQPAPGPRGETSLVATIAADGAQISGLLVTVGSRRGSFLQSGTGKTVARLVPLKGGELRVSVTDRSAGLTTTTLVLCEGSRPDYAAAGRLRQELAGGWHEVTATGRVPVTVRGPEGCTAAEGPDLAFRTGQALEWRQYAKTGAADWRTTSETPDTFIGGLWLTTSIGPDGQTRFVTIRQMDGAPRLIVADPVSKTFSYYSRCPG
jgi:hypothetical protein